MVQTNHSHFQIYVLLATCWVSECQRSNFQYSICGKSRGGPAMYFWLISTIFRGQYKLGGWESPERRRGYPLNKSSTGYFYKQPNFRNYEFIVEFISVAYDTKTINLLHDTVQPIFGNTLVAVVCWYPNLPWSHGWRQMSNCHPWSVSKCTSDG